MIKLIYFDFDFWRIDILRLSLSFAKIPYDYQRIPRKEWPSTKKKFPFGQLPVMILNGKYFSQTHSLAKFCAKQSSLYDNDDMKVLIIDQVLDWANEITNHIAPSIRAAMREKDFVKSKRLRKEFIEKDLLTWFSYLEKLFIESSLQSKFFTDKFSIADITAWRLLFWFCSGKLDMIPSSFLDKVPVLKKYYNDISNYTPLNQLKEFKSIINLS